MSRPGTYVPAVRVETEKALGITQRSAAINFAWTGDIRKRYVYLFSVLSHTIHEIVDCIVDHLNFDEPGMLGDGSADSSMTWSRSQLRDIRASSPADLTLAAVISNSPAYNVLNCQLTHASFTDFLVNEIRKDGVVLHLRDFEEQQAPAPVSSPFQFTTPVMMPLHVILSLTATSQVVIDRKASAAPIKKPDEKPTIIQIPEEDRKALADLLGEPTAQKLVQLDETGQAKKGVLPPKERTITFDAITDRTKRGTIHQVCGHLLSPTLTDNIC
jgi:hypothetical protein